MKKVGRYIRRQSHENEKDPKVRKKELKEIKKKTEANFWPTSYGKKKRIPNEDSSLSLSSKSLFISFYHIVHIRAWRQNPNLFLFPTKMRSPHWQMKPDEYGEPPNRDRPNEAAFPLISKRKDNVSRDYHGTQRRSNRLGKFVLSSEQICGEGLKWGLVDWTLSFVHAFLQANLR